MSTCRFFFRAILFIFFFFLISHFERKLNRFECQRQRSWSKSFEAFRKQGDTVKLWFLVISQPNAIKSATRRASGSRRRGRRVHFKSRPKECEEEGQAEHVRVVSCLATIATTVSFRYLRTTQQLVKAHTGRACRRLGRWSGYLSNSNRFKFKQFSIIQLILKSFCNVILDFFIFVCKCLKIFCNCNFFELLIFFLNNSIKSFF